MKDLKHVNGYNKHDPKDEFEELVGKLIETHQTEFLYKSHELKKLNVPSSNREPFIEKAVEIAQKHPELIPSSFDSKRFLKLFEDYKINRDKMNQLIELLEIIKQKCYVAGHEVYALARTFKKIIHCQCETDEQAVECFEELEEKNTLKTTRQSC